MRGRILAGTLVLSMVFLLGNFNQEVQAQPLGGNEAGSMEILEISEQEVPVWSMAGQNEGNNFERTATAVTWNSPVSDVISHPDEVDYYALTAEEPAVISYSISSSDGYSLLYVGKSGDEAAMRAANDDMYQVMPGTYYFAVASESGTYSEDSTYKVSFEKIAPISSDSALDKYVSKDAGIIYEANAERTLNYVNGKPIDISYSYVKELSNSAGMQSYDIKIDTASHNGSIVSDWSQAAAVHYYKSTRPAMQVSSRPALMLTFRSDSDFYHIDCYGTGAYRMNTYLDDMDSVTVLIDPDTGKLIDIVEFNYFYDFAPVGSNSITWARVYKWDNQA